MIFKHAIRPTWQASQEESRCVVVVVVVVFWDTLLCLSRGRKKVYQARRPSVFFFALFKFLFLFLCNVIWHFFELRFDSPFFIFPAGSRVYSYEYSSKLDFIALILYVSCLLFDRRPTSLYLYVRLFWQRKISLPGAAETGTISVRTFDECCNKINRAAAWQTTDQAAWLDKKTKAQKKRE